MDKTPWELLLQCHAELVQLYCPQKQFSFNPVSAQGCEHNLKKSNFIIVFTYAIV